MVTSVDGGLRPAHTLANPFPDGLVQPTGSSRGLATLLGTGLSNYDYHEIAQDFQVVATGVSPSPDSRTSEHWFNGASLSALPGFTPGRNL